MDYLDKDSYSILFRSFSLKIITKKWESDNRSDSLNPYTSLCAYHFFPLNLQTKMVPLTTHSKIIADQTPIIPKPKVIPKIYPRTTRTSHIDSSDVIEVKFASPAARNAEGIVKLCGKKNG